MNHALDCTLERESRWSQKTSSIVQCQLNLNRVEDTVDVNNSSWKVVKKSVKNVLEDDASTYWEKSVEPLLCQGQFVKLLTLEDENLTWKSIMYNLPKRVIKLCNQLMY